MGLSNTSKSSYIVKCAYITKSSLGCLKLNFFFFFFFACHIIKNFPNYFLGNYFVHTSLGTWFEGTLPFLSWIIYLAYNLCHILFTPIILIGDMINHYFSWDLKFKLILLYEYDNFYLYFQSILFFNLHYTLLTWPSDRRSSFGRHHPGVQEMLHNLLVLQVTDGLRFLIIDSTFYNL